MKLVPFLGFLAFFLRAPALAQAKPASPPAAVVGTSTGEDDDGNFDLGGGEALPNFHQVSTGVYRMGQPSAEGLRILAGLGVRTILDLRQWVGPEEKREAERLGMKVESVPMNGLFTPSFEEIDRALRVLSDPSRRPVAVHCRYGRDRTGYSVAAWRVMRDSMDAGSAAAEARGYGCCPAIWKDLKAFLLEYSRR